MKGNWYGERKSVPSYSAHVGTQAELALQPEVTVIPARMFCRKPGDGFHGRS